MQQGPVDAKKLRSNMIADGIVEPTYANSAHHIVMSNSTDNLMTALRSQMAKLKIDINDAANGVFLPTSTAVKDAAKTVAQQHSRTHTNLYKENVSNMLKDISDPKVFKETLRDIGKQLQAGTFEVKKP